MNWIDVLTAPLDKDLSAFGRFLLKQGISHRIIECGGRQVLRSCHDPKMIRIWFEQWCAGQLDVPPPSKVDGISYSKLLRKLVWCYPVVLTTAIFAILVYFISLYSNAPITWLAFQDIEVHKYGSIHADASIDEIMSGQWWRLLTPIFLHFGLLHLVFNGLWLVEFGRRIESLQSHGRLIVVIVSSAIISNLCQYIYEPSILFGGLSGVIYGLFGYCWLWGYWESRSPSGAQSGIAPPPGIAPFLLLWLLLCMSGILSVVGIHVANAAHIGGLISGLVAAWIYSLKSRITMV